MSIAYCLIERPDGWLFVLVQSVAICGVGGYWAGALGLLADGGVENWNSGVDELIESGILRRLLAMTEITFSNSLVESWWRVLKHQWLYLNSLDSVATVRRLVSFYIAEHNTRLPHSAFRGQTPDEMYFGTGNQIPKALEEARTAARRTRLMLNRAASCSVCEA